MNEDLPAARRADAERDRAAESLGWSEQHFDEAQAHGRVGSWTWSVLTNGVIWSQELRRMYGVPADAPVDRVAFLALLHGDDRQRVEERIADADRRRERSYDLEYRIVRADGEERLLHARHIAAYDVFGVPIHRAGRVLDVTGLRPAAPSRLGQVDRRIP